MNKTSLTYLLIFLFVLNKSFAQTHTNTIKRNDIATDPAKVFQHPLQAAKPGVLWMGTNISKDSITKDLKELKKQGFNRTAVFSLAGITTLWAGKNYDWTIT